VARDAHAMSRAEARAEAVMALTGPDGRSVAQSRRTASARSVAHQRASWGNIREFVAIRCAL
jgi:hypothetical protein